MLRINNLKIREDLSNDKVIEYALNKYKIDKNDLLNIYISKKSIDARKKDDVHYNYSFDLEVKDENKYKKLDKVKKLELPAIQVNIASKSKPIIVGAGPAGLFAALTFVQNGIKPIIIEQGKPIEDRIQDVETFKKTGRLNNMSNIQFGEGGAGTFSDGKLTTGINSPYCKKVLQEFVNFGAPSQILYLNKPHIGTDNLINIIKNIREYIISKGGEFLFNEKVTDFEIIDNKVVMKFDNNKVTINTFSGKYIDFERLLGRRGDINIRVMKNDLLKSTERASLLASVQNNNLIRFNIQKDVMYITSLNEEGNIEEKVEIINDGEDLNIGINSKYLKDALSVIDEEEIMINFKDSVSPCIIGPLKGDKYNYLILPIRMN